mmetsp:Transcript_21439/g.46753  ORF Transcript_21439/g.46753 Transcript_21439/m.46753 type:complete len:434 (-) Transcript_21439:32-1333(-)
MNQLDDSDDSEVDDNVVASLSQSKGGDKAAPIKGGDDDDGLFSSSDSESDSGKKKILKKKKKKLSKKGDDGKKKKKKKKPEDAEEAAAEGKAEEDAGAFIASDDDNEELLTEYKNQKEYASDEDPYAGLDDNEIEAEMIRKEQERARELDDVDPNSFKAVLKGMNERKNAMRKAKITDMDKERIVDGLLVRMKKAALQDNKARASRKPAIHKLGMLDDVCLSLQRQDLQLTCLDRGALRILGDWLRPSKVDNQLPAQTIRTRIIQVLPQLQIETSHLQHSKFGKVVNFLSNHPKELPANKQILTNLMHEWSRSIFKRKSTYGGGPPVQDDGGEDGEGTAPSPAKKKKVTQVSPKKTLNDLSRSRKDKLQGKNSEKKEKKNYRASIPQPMNFGFTYQPKSRLQVDEAEATRMEGYRPSAKRVELEKKVLKKRKR